MAAVVRVMVVEPHALLRDGLRHLLAADDGVEVVGDAPSAEAAVEVAAAARPDVVVVEPTEARAGPAVQQLREAAPGARVLVLTDSDAPVDLAAALSAGAGGYLLKRLDGERLVAAVHDVHDGATVVAPELTTHVLTHVRAGRIGPALTRRQREVLQCVADGLADRQIAASLDISARTVQKHVEHLLRRFDVHDRGTLVREARRTGMLEPV